MGEPHDEDDTDPDPIERRLNAAKEKLRAANERLTTRENALIALDRRRAEDDIPTRPVVDFPKKP
jgi:hypothetical protein